MNDADFVGFASATRLIQRVCTNESLERQTLCEVS
jgi:hypothetical protein